ncbi:MAG: efflux RND transporter permease subunit [Cecembia sp.]
MLKSALSFSWNYPQSTLVALLLISVGFGLGIKKLETRNSFAGELPSNDPVQVHIDQINQVFGERSVVLIGIEAEDVYTEEVSEKVIAISEALKEVPFVMADEIISLSTVQNVSNREWGLEIGGFFEEFPTDEEAWKQLKVDVHDNAMILNRLVSKDGQLMVIAASLEDGFEGGVVYEAVENIISGYQSTETIHSTGAPMLVEDVQRGISGDSRKFIPIAIVIIFFGFYICFRRISGVLLPVSMVIMSIVWTMGAMGYLGLPVTVVSNALPVIMVAVASSYGIHFMNTYFQLAAQYTESKALVIATVTKVGVPILLTGVTSALGSASLLIFKITSLKEFGVIGAIGFLLATFICLTLLSALCSLIQVPKSKPKQDNMVLNLLNYLTEFSQKYKSRVTWGYVLILPIFLFFSSKINIGDDYMKFFPPSHKGRIAAETFNEKLHGVRVMDLVVATDLADGIKGEQFFEELTAFKSWLENEEQVGSTYSYVDVVRHLQKTMNPTEDASISQAEIAQYLMLHEMSATPGEVFALRTEDASQAKMQVFLKSSDPEEHKKLYEKIQSAQSKFFSEGEVSLLFGGDVMQRISLGSYIVKGKIQNIILALLIVFVVCLLIFSSFRKALLTLLPIAVSLIMVFGVMGMIGIRLGISTSLLTAMIVGIGIDFSIHYLHSYFNYLKEYKSNQALYQTSQLTGRAIAYDAISNIVGFSVLSFSGFLPVQHFGWLLAFSMLLIFLNTMLLFPAVLLEKSKSHADQENEHPKAFEPLLN